MSSRGAPAAALAALCALAPGVAAACACGCGVFSVGAGSLMPLASRGELFLEYDFMDQGRDWSGSAGAPSARNPDKEIKTSFFTLGGQYRINRNWGLMVEAPIWDREFRTQAPAGVQIDTFRHAALGDVRLMGLYSGLAADQSTGLILGAKLPTGDWRYGGFDRDTEIGSGSTDLLIGGYHVGALTTDRRWTYFAQALGELPLASQGGYRPGDEVDGAVGLYFHAATAAGGKLSFSPTLQLVGSARARDSGVNSNRADSGYQRLLVSAGLEVDAGPWTVYGDVGLPVYQHVNGKQLVAPLLVKLTLTRGF